METETLRAEGLVKSYGRGDIEVRALDDVSFATRRGQVSALLGPSGAGKSTLLQALGLLVLPEKGTIRIGGELVVENGRSHGDLSLIRRSRMGFVFQKATLLPFLTARENVFLALDINGKRGAAAHSRVASLLSYLGLGKREEHYPAMLSGGQQQRVAIARAIANGPEVIFADEPTASLDRERGRAVMELLRKVAHDHGTTVVVVTHDHRMLDLFDTVHEMEDGRLRDAPPATALA